MSEENQAPRRIGERLKQAREQQGISVAEAAERLHILPSYVTAMETGRYGVLPGTVFLRGYVRSYARFLGLNESEIVSQLDRELGASDENQQRIKRDEAASSKSSQGPKAVVLATMLILVLGGLWYFQQQSTVVSPENEPVMAQDEEQPVEVPVIEPEPESMTEGEDTSFAEMLPQDSDEFSENTEDSTEPLVSQEPDETEPSIVGDDESTGTPVVSEEPNNEAPVAEVPQPVQPEKTAELAQDRLEVSFSGDSWFELTDSEGNRRVGLFREGQRLNYEGQAPFRIVVGAVSETSMVFNGTPVDFSNYRVRNNRAGLTLGQ